MLPAAGITYADHEPCQSENGYIGRTKHRDPAIEQSSMQPSSSSASSIASRILPSSPCRYRSLVDSCPGLISRLNGRKQEENSHDSTLRKKISHESTP